MPSRDRQYREKKRKIRREVRGNPSLDPVAFQNDFYPELHSLGKLDQICEHCHARFFPSERPISGRYIKCCRNGKINLSSPKNSGLIHSLLTTNNVESRGFITNIRSYNAALAMVSAKAKIDEQLGSYLFKVHGNFYHGHGPLIPDNNQVSSHAQLYFYDTDEANRIRLNHDANRNFSRVLLNRLSNFLDEVNPYVQSYRSVFDVIRSGEFGEPKDLHMIIFTDPKNDPRRYNAPISTDVAAIFTSSDGSPPGERDLVLYPFDDDKSIKRISVLSPFLDPLSYPLLFPEGELGWHPGLPFTMLQYAQYRISLRSNDDLIHLSQKLYLQWIVDMYIRIEGTRLEWIRLNQRTLRVETYKGLSDYVKNKAENHNARVGKFYVLPSTFINSPRNMESKYQDAMSIIGKYGKPDLFITFTANPNWKEITDNLRPGESAWMRPELIVRVFHQKLKELINDITNKKIFGTVVVIIYTIEFQKRGLPHAHILISLEDDSKIKDLDKVDKVVSAELPDMNIDKDLFNYVTTHMIHGPCGSLNSNAPCMKNQLCSKNFPKDFCETTRENLNGFPVYRRRNDKRTAEVRGRTIDNRWVVPYNRYLLLKYKAHINVEVCTTVKSVKYIYKYIYKGFDCITASISSSNQFDYDEIKAYLDARWVGSCEACWRILEYEMHYQNHTVIRLDCHLPNEQKMYFQEGSEQQVIDFPKTTKLLAWFNLNKEDDTAHQWLYREIPEHYKWEDNKWKPRARSAKVVSRLYTVSPKQIECYFLRLLLLHVKGAKSFEDLRTVIDTNSGEKVLCESFQQAAIHRGIAANDGHWQKTIEEAIDSCMPYQIRHLFAVICGMNVPSNCLELWTLFGNAMSEDFLRNYEEDQAYNLALLEIEEVLLTHNTSCRDLGLPIPTRVVISESTQVIDDQKQLFENLFKSANNDQRQVISAVISAIQNPQMSNIFFLDAPAGCGKTYVQRCLIAYIKHLGSHCIPVATTGIAASLLEGGRTKHSQFKLPINLMHETVSGVTPNSALGQYIKNAKLLIIDEISSALSEILTILDRFYRDISDVDNRDKIFGGHVVLMCGDFRQCLPVIPHGLRATTVEHCVKFNPIWKSVKKFELKQNMRVNEGEEEFANYILEVGNGTLMQAPDMGPDKYIISRRLRGIGTPIEFIYDGQDLLSNSIIDSAILCPTNEYCYRINLEVLSTIKSVERVYYSIDKINSNNSSDELKFSTEFLNSIEVSGLPRHKLILKVGAIVMLMRNINTAKGLINGTRLRIISLFNNMIECLVLTGTSRGLNVLIPRIKLSVSQSVLPFEFERLQFPIALDFAFTINKAQGQSLNKVAIYLEKPVFSHGQLYVALSRARGFDSVKIFVKHGKEQITTSDGDIYTKNVVWKEVFV